MIRIALAAALVAAVPTTASAGPIGDFFESISSEHLREAVLPLCERSLQASLNGDPDYLQRFFDRAPRTPDSFRIVYLRICLAYATGFRDGVSESRRR